MLEFLKRCSSHRQEKAPLLEPLSYRGFMDVEFVVFWMVLMESWLSPLGYLSTGLGLLATQEDRI